MIDVDEEGTNDFNQMMIVMIENMIEQNIHYTHSHSVNNNFIRFDFDTMFEDFTISNIMNVSMEEDNDRVLLKHDEVELKFDGKKYNKTDIEEKCCVCLTELEENEFIYCCKNCNNINHYDCMNEWVKRKVECPQCRNNLEKFIIVKDHFVKFIDTKLDI
jgi:hypothetical protein